MKKNYMTPETELVEMDMPVCLLADSDDIVSEDYGLGYGGVDEEGEKDPD